MRKIAVDIVLLLGDDIAERAIRANKGLREKFDSDIVLNMNNCLPHISLAMGCIDESDIEAVEKVLAETVKANRLQELMIDRVHIGVNSRGQNISSFAIEMTDRLRKLHCRVMDEMEKFFRYDVTSDMVLGDDIADTTLAWICSYRAKSAFEKFFPHITIGYGQAEPIERAITFKPPAIALCHLGNHCTCRKVLAHLPLDEI